MVYKKIINGVPSLSSLILSGVFVTFAGNCKKDQAQAPTENKPKPVAGEDHKGSSSSNGQSQQVIDSKSDQVIDQPDPRGNMNDNQKAILADALLKLHQSSEIFARFSFPTFEIADDEIGDLNRGAAKKTTQWFIDWNKRLQENPYKILNVPTEATSLSKYNQFDTSIRSIGSLRGGLEAKQAYARAYKFLIDKYNLIGSSLKKLETLCLEKKSLDISSQPITLEINNLISLCEDKTPASEFSLKRKFTKDKALGEIIKTKDKAEITKNIEQYSKVSDSRDFLAFFNVTGKDHKDWDPTNVLEAKIGNATTQPLLGYIAAGISIDQHGIIQPNGTDFTPGIEIAANATIKHVGNRSYLPGEFKTSIPAWANRYDLSKTSKNNMLGTPIPPQLFEVFNINAGADAFSDIVAIAGCQASSAANQLAQCNVLFPDIPNAAGGPSAATADDAAGYINDKYNTPEQLFSQKQITFKELLFGLFSGTADEDCFKFVIKNNALERFVVTTKKLGDLLFHSTLDDKDFAKYLYEHIQSGSEERKKMVVLGTDQDMIAIEACKAELEKLKTTCKTEPADADTWKNTFQIPFFLQLQKLMDGSRYMKYVAIQVLKKLRSDEQLIAGDPTSHLAHTLSLALDFSYNQQAKRAPQTPAASSFNIDLAIAKIIKTIDDAKNSLLVYHNSMDTGYLLGAPGMQFKRLIAQLNDKLTLRVEKGHSVSFADIKEATGNAIDIDTIREDLKSLAKQVKKMAESEKLVTGLLQSEDPIGVSVLSSKELGNPKDPSKQLALSQELERFRQKFHAAKAAPATTATAPKK